MTNENPKRSKDESDQPTDPKSADDPPVDLDATIEVNDGDNLDATLDDADVTLDDATLVDPDATLVDLDQTIEANDQTVIETDQTIAETEQTLLEDATVQDAGTVLGDRDIAQTINPRDLSSEDQTYWSHLSQEFTANSGTAASFSAVDPVIVGSKLPLRGRHVTTPQQSETEASDYRLVRLLGKGGMGNVFVARQGSLDRLIAVKIIKPLEEDKREQLRKQGRLEATENNRRQQFLTEAVITGDLDHPNIVPIHDVALTGENTLFYAMKRVIGTPWNKVIQEKSRDENIEILIKVADAIAFAHTRGIVHRDIKPENVMLGDFGVVMVMDWGIALATSQFEKLDSITPATGLGGTPSFMAPEMATGPLESVGPAADVYLLGATLFMIITGKAPHQAPNVRECLRAVANNDIRPFDPRHEGELMNIALRAMADRPEQRYASVTDFQDALREYRSHAESIALAARAKDDWDAAIQSQSYTLFSKATFGFEEALHLWPGNQTARDGIAKVRLAHAQAAYDNKDFDLGLSLLGQPDPVNEALPEKIELATKLHAAIAARHAKEKRFTLLKRSVAAMLAFIFVGGSIALVTINAKEREARRNAELAEEQSALALKNLQQATLNEQRALEGEKLAEENAELAKVNEAEAKKNAALAQRESDRAKANAKKAQDNAEDARRNEMRAERNALQADLNAAEADRNAEEARLNAEKARLAQASAEYESYVSQVGLAKARVDRNEFADARRILADLIALHQNQSPDQPLPWELRWLSAVTNQSKLAIQLPGTVTKLSLGKTENGIALIDDGRVLPMRMSDTRSVTIGTPWSSPDSIRITAAVMMDMDDQIAVGKSTGEVEIWSANFRRLLKRLPGHEGPITDLKIAGKGRLVSASMDRTVRVWELNSMDAGTINDSATRYSEHWHIGPVNHIDALATDDEIWIAAVVNDSNHGRVSVWSVNTKQPQNASQRGTFAKHNSPVTAIQIINGDASGAPQFASGDSEGHVLIWKVSDLPESDPSKRIQLAMKKISSTDRKPPTESSSTTIETRPIHRGGVQTIEYDRSLDQLLTAGGDYVVRIWDRDPSADDSPPANKSSFPWQESRQLRGHGGSVLAAAFASDAEGDVISVGKDQTLRYWNRHVGADEDQVNATKPDLTDETVAHDDEIWSARFSPDGSQVVTSSRDHTARVLPIRADMLGFEDEFDLIDPARESVGSLEEGTAFGAMSMRIDAPNRRLFLGNADSTVRIWDIDRGTELASVRGTGLNDVMAVSRNGRWLATGSSSADADVLVWRVEGDSPRLVHRLEGHEESVAALTISPDNRRLFTGDRAGRGRIWDLDSGNPIGDPIDELLGFRINTAEFSLDSKNVWIGADDQRLSRWNLDSRSMEQRLDTDGFVAEVVLSPDGDQAITIDQSQRTDRTISTVTWWELKTGRFQTLTKMTSAKDEITNSGGRPQIGSAAFSSDSKTARVCVAPSGDRPSRIEAWDVSDAIGTAKRIAAFGTPSRIGDCTSVATLSRDRFVTMHGNSAFLWDVQSQTHLKSYRAHGAVTRAVHSRSGQHVLTASRSVKVWDIATGKTIGKLESPHQGTVRAIAVAPRAPFRFATGGDDASICVWDFNVGEGTFERVLEWNHPSLHGGITSLDYCGDGSCLLASTDQGCAAMIRCEDKTHMSLVGDVSIGKLSIGRFSSDHQWVAVGGNNKQATLYRVGDWIAGKAPAGWRPDPAITFVGHAEPITDLHVLSNPTRLFTASRDRSVRVWDTTGRVLLELRGHKNALSAIDLTTDGDLMLTASQDGTVRLWPATPIR